MSIHDRRVTKFAVKIARSPRGYARDLASPRCSPCPWNNHGAAARASCCNITCATRTFVGVNQRFPNFRIRILLHQQRTGGVLHEQRQQPLPHTAFADEAHHLRGELVQPWPRRPHVEYRLHRGRLRPAPTISSPPRSAPPCPPSWPRNADRPEADRGPDPPWRGSTDRRAPSQTPDRESRSRLRRS